MHTTTPSGTLPAPDAGVILEPGIPVDVRLTLGVLQRGHADPTVQSRPEGVWLCFRQPGAGDPVTLLVRPAPYRVPLSRRRPPAAR